MTRAVLSRYDAADYLGVSVDTLDRLRAAGAIIACPVSARLVKYRLADLDAYLTTCQISALSKSPPARTVSQNVFSLLVPILEVWRDIGVARGLRLSGWESPAYTR